MLSSEQISQLNKERLAESNHEKAETFASRKNADAENGISSFIDRHSGFLAVSREDVVIPNEANVKLLCDWITDQGLLITDANLEKAFVACAARLAPYSPGEYTRKTDLSVSRIAPQVKSFAPAAIRAPFTKAEILGWSTSRLRLEVRRFGIEEINRILEQ